jgi:hypothetical protein
MNWIEISSFDQVPIDSPHTLIICDIDETLLHFPDLTLEKYNQVLEYYNSIHSDYELALANTNSHWSQIFVSSQPSHTDMDGFRRLLLRLHLYNGGLCFLTARPGHESNIEFTKSNFAAIRLEYSAFVVHYSGLIPKGEFIRNKIDLSYYSDVIFIDDMDYNLLDVSSRFGQRIKCFKFVHQNK